MVMQFQCGIVNLMVGISINFKCWILNKKF